MLNFCVCVFGNEKDLEELKLIVFFLSQGRKGRMRNATNDFSRAI